MSYYKSITIVILFFLLCSSIYTQQDESNSEIDPVKSFKEYLSDHFASYDKDKREQLSNLGGGWVKEYYEPADNYKIDVKKTNSLITPFTGFCEFTIIRHYTDFHQTMKDASKDSEFIKTDKLIHRHKYGFQEGKWVVTSRKHKDPELDKIEEQFNWNSSLDNWYDCDQIIKLGDNKGASDIFGCWEKETE